MGLCEFSFAYSSTPRVACISSSSSSFLSTSKPVLSVTFSAWNDGGPSSRPKRAQTVALFCDSWRHPRWLDHRSLSAGCILGHSESIASRQDGLDKTSDGQFTTYNADSWAELARLCLRTTLRSTQSLPIGVTVVKISVSMLLALFVSLAWTGYDFINSSTSAQLSAYTRTFMDRDIRIGRLRRISFPASLHFARTSLSEPLSPNQTAPRFFSSGVKVSLSHIAAAMLRRSPLRINLTIDSPFLSLHQKTSLGADGKLIARWDPGVSWNSSQTSSSPTEDFSPVEDSIPVHPLPPIAPGTLKIKNATLVFQPAELPSYGQGSEPVEIRNVNGQLTLTNQVGISSSDETNRGSLTAVVEGKPVGGGRIKLEAISDLHSIKGLRAGHKLATLTGSGFGVRANKISSFLNLPFRADNGTCDGTIQMQFIHMADSQIPEMQGEASLRDVSLRFHPDPKTPEITGVSGKLRFDERTIFMDGPHGDLGKLPLTVIGSIDLLGEYNLLGHVRNVNVNSIIDTFDIEKFLPVEGVVRGEAKMTGLLEEPFVQGWAISVGPGKIDKLPLDNAKVEFEWEAQAGVLKFNDIQAEVTGGGNVSGSGGMYFDMTKITPFNMNRPSHHQNSPKAQFWNPDSETLHQLPQPPVDDFEIDRDAPSRPYDSMLFTFQVQNLNGSNLVKHYGGKFGDIGAASIGHLDGEAVIAGHAKDANCRVFWATTSKPPLIHFVTGNKSVQDSNNSRSSTLSTAEAEVTEAYQRATNEAFQTLRDIFSIESEQKVVMTANNSGTFPGSECLGNAELQGVVFMKLGDLPSARRIKMRTTVSSFDLRRAAWGQPQFKKYLANTPLLEASFDTYFRGVLHQKALPNMEYLRTPRHELIGAEGALAVRDLRINKFAFPTALTGSLQFEADGVQVVLTRRESLSKNESAEQGTSDVKPASKTLDNLANCEKFRIRFCKVQAPAARNLVGNGGAEDGNGNMDQIRVSASRTGNTVVAIRRLQTDFFSTFERDPGQKKMLRFRAHSVDLNEILGGDGKGMNGVPTGLLNMDGTVNLSERNGGGRISLQNARYSGLELRKFLGFILWEDNRITMKNSHAQVNQSEYDLEGSYVLRTAEGVGPSNFVWELKVKVPRMDVREITRVLQSRRRRRQRLRHELMRQLSPEHDDVQVSGMTSGLMSALQAADAAEDSAEFAESWFMPDLPFEDLVAWFAAYERAASQRIKLEDKLFTSKRSSGTPLPGLSDIRGYLQGNIILRYDSGASKQSSTGRRDFKEKGKLVQALLEPLGKFHLDFDIQGYSWKIGTHVVGDLSVIGQLSNNKLQLYPLHVKGSEGFEMLVEASAASNGMISCHSFVRNASAALFSQYSRGNFRLDGKMSARTDIMGTIADPRVDARVSWSDAMLNNKRVHGASGEVRCRDGRCELNMQGRLGGRDRFENAAELDVHQVLGRAKSDASTEQSADDVGNKRRTTHNVDGDRLDAQQSKSFGEPLMVSISAPVRFYVVEYLRGSVPSKLWNEIEPLLSYRRDRDQDWISMDIDVRKYGLLLANTAFPSLGWIDGTSDVNLRVRGTIQEPVVEGRASVNEGQLWPTGLPRPIEGVKGEVVFEDCGSVVVKSLYGRCNGRSISVSGALPLSEKHLKAVADIATQIIPNSKTLGKAERRQWIYRKSWASKAVQRFARGITIDISEVPVYLKDQFTGHISGRIVAKGSLVSPTISGSVVISRGVVYLANPPLSPDAIFRAVTSMTPGARKISQSDVEPKVPAVKALRGRRDPEDRSNSVPNDSNYSKTEKRLIRLNNLKLTLGKEVDIVYPYLLNFGVTGTISLRGTTRMPSPSGIIRFTRGDISILASRLELKRDVDNFARFEESDDPSRSLDPVVSFALEDRDIVLQVKDARASEWSQQLSVVNKRGDYIDDKKWAGLIQARFEEIQKGMAAGSGLPSLLLRQLINTSVVKGKLGSSEWRIFPALVSPFGKMAEPSIADDIGIGAEFHYGMLTFSLKRSWKGSNAGEIVIRPTDRIKLHFEADGPVFSSEAEIQLSPGPPRSEDIIEEHYTFKAPHWDQPEKLPDLKELNR